MYRAGFSKPAGTWMHIAAAAALFLSPARLDAWGFWGHRLMTRLAVQALTPELRAAFQPLADSLAAHSIDPDLWRNFDENEGPRHYIDLEKFGTFPFADLPFDYQQAVARFTEDSVKAAGIAPWRIMDMIDSLAFAMKSRRASLIVRYAAALAHYVEDIHMPLHTTVNYDGQLSGNDGIHSRYERWMLEAHQEAIREGLRPRPGRVLQNPLPVIFDWIFDSYVWVDNLLRADFKARQPGKRYEKLEDFDSAYYERLFRETRSFTFRQMSQGITAVASCWLTAWERAGRPDLANLN